MQKTQSEKLQNVKDERLYVRVTPEEKMMLKELAERRNVDLSVYVREVLFSNKTNYLYTSEFTKIIYNITNLLVYKVSEYCCDEKFISECKRGAEELWHYLK